MKKSCCVDNVNITPRSSSCSMVLRSDCTHGHSRKSVMINKLQKQEGFYQERKISNHYTSELESYESSTAVHNFHSSLKQLAFKSAKTYSILKDRLYSHFEQPKTEANYVKNEKCSEFEKRGCYSLLNPAISPVECTYINNNCITTDHLSMSGLRDFSRQSLSSPNALSESEDESPKDNIRNRKVTTRSAAKNRFSETVSANHTHQTHSSSYSYIPSASHTSLSSMQGALFSSSEVRAPFSTAQGASILSSEHYHQTTSNNASYRPDLNLSSGSNASTETSASTPSVIDISSVQDSPFDKFRWLFVRQIYLWVIRCVNFDVWLLSRLRDYKKSFIIVVLTCLLSYFLFAALLSDSSTKSFDNLSSSVISFSSNVYSSLLSHFVHSKDNIEESSLKESHFWKILNVPYSLLLAILNSLCNCYVWFSNSILVFGKSSHSTSQVVSETKIADLKSIAVEVVDEKLKDIIMKIESAEIDKNIQEERKDSIKNLQNEISKLRLEFQLLMETLKKSEDVSQKSERSSHMMYLSIIEDQKTEIASLNRKMKDFEERFSFLSGSVKNCCDDKWSLSNFTSSFEEHFLVALKNIIDGDNKDNSPYFFFNKWLYSKLASDKDKLSQQIQLEFKKLEEEQKTAHMKYDENSKAVLESIVRRYVEALRKDFNSFSEVKVTSDSSVSLDGIQSLIKQAIMLYDADKTGKVDYALESGGGSVLSTRCSESYADKDGTISVLGFPLWTTHNSPRIAIQPSMQPGQCWAFKGSQGFLVIQLSYKIHPTGFTMEHIPVSLSPSGSIDSAPKDFSVWGLASEQDNEGKLLGEYSFDQYGDSLQYFEVQNTYDEPYSFVEIRIHSNHGNLDYTCLYRFRVHGNQPKH